MNSLADASRGPWRQRLVLFLQLLAFLFVLNGCSTLLLEKKQKITVLTRAERLNGVQVFLHTTQSVRVKRLPAFFSVPRTHRRVLLFVADPRFGLIRYRLRRDIHGTFWLNFFNLGIGFAVDLLTGNLWVYESPVVLDVSEENLDPR